MVVMSQSFEYVQTSHWVCFKVSGKNKTEAHGLYTQISAFPAGLSILETEEHNRRPHLFHGRTIV